MHVHPTLTPFHNNAPGRLMLRTNVLAFFLLAWNQPEASAYVIATLQSMIYDTAAGLEESVRGCTTRQLSCRSAVITVQRSLHDVDRQIELLHWSAVKIADDTILDFPVHGLQAASYVYTSLVKAQA